MQAKIDIIIQAEENGFITDFFTTVSECMPDGTHGRILNTRNGTLVLTIIIILGQISHGRRQIFSSSKGRINIINVPLFEVVYKPI